MTYLEVHPPLRTQFRTKRRPPKGASGPVVTAIAVHTAENTTDLFGPDSGAENVARFISTRSDPGSYHSVVDSDSTVRVGRYEWEMFGEGTGGNRWVLHLSFACTADSWPVRLADSSWHVNALRNGAIEAARMIQWVHDVYGVAIPARVLTAKQYRSGTPGFIGHRHIDPDRRTDPGGRFPWGVFFDEVQDQVELLTGEPPMAPPVAHVEAIQGALVAAGINIGQSGSGGNGIDGALGPRTVAGVQQLGTQFLALSRAKPSKLEEIGLQFLNLVQLADQGEW